jgi:lambda family phage portal protein
MTDKRQVSILGPDGSPLPVRMEPPRRRRLALAGGGGSFSGPAYDAADIYGQHMAAWTPYLWSPDAEVNPYRDRIVSRIRDMVRNDGWASGGVTRMLDNVIGATLRPISKPDFKFLALSTGNKAFDHEWSKEFAKAVDANWRSWSQDELGRYCDAARNQTFVEQMRVAFRHKLIDGDALAVMMFLPGRVGVGRARYATAVQLVDPDRLSNPQLRFDQHTLRGGVEIDDYGAAVAYHIRKAHAGDWFSAQESLTWERVPRETWWGRPVVVHDYDGDRAAVHRGGAGVFAPVIQRLKMLAKYDSVEMDSAIINSIFAAYVESPFDHELMAEALDDGERVSGYQMARTEFHNESSLLIGNSRIPILFPGEKINTVAATRPNATNFAQFEGAVLRNFASGIGISAQQASNDWSDVNYSSARGALLEAWKTLDRRRVDFTEGFASPIRAAWLEEAMDEDDLPLPKNAPSFLEARNAYSRCRWMGPARGWIDPVAEKQGAVMGMDAALSTLEDECAMQGLDYEEVLEQRKYELELFEDMGIPLPAWAGQFVTQQQQRPTTGVEAEQVAKPPKKPKAA